MTKPKPLRVEMKIRNNRILREIEATGLSVPKFCKKHGLAYGTIIHYIALDTVPDGPRGIKESAVKLCAVLGCLIEDLWPEELDYVTKAKSMAEISFSQFNLMLHEPTREMITERVVEHAENLEISEKLDKIIKRVLSPREQEILKLREARVLFTEIAEQFGLSPNRINQLYHRAKQKVYDECHSVDPNGEVFPISKQYQPQKSNQHQPKRPNQRRYYRDGWILDD